VGTFENCPWPPDYEVVQGQGFVALRGKPSFQHVEGGIRSQIPCTHGTSSKQPSSNQQAATSQRDAASSKQQATSSKQEAEGSKEQAATIQQAAAS
jgi:hypothetical protein